MPNDLKTQNTFSPSVARARLLLMTSSNRVCIICCPATSCAPQHCTLNQESGALPWLQHLGLVPSAGSSWFVLSFVCIVSYWSKHSHISQVLFGEIFFKDLINSSVSWLTSYKTVKKKSQNWDEKFNWSYMNCFVVVSFFKHFLSKNMKFAYSGMCSALNWTAAYLP